jgi:ABC-type phosphate transport system ATPase subunit
MDTNEAGARTVFQFSNYRLVQDDFVLLQDLNFQIQSGDSVAIVGPTGSGKSLLLGVMQQSLWGIAPREKRLQKARTLWRESGQAWILGLKCAPELPPPEALSQIHGDIALVRESSVWLPLSIAENFLASQRLAGKTTVLSFEQIVQDFGPSPRNRALLMSLAEQYPGQIEAPYLQYLAIIRALVRRPKVLLLDEALIRLDPILLRHAESLLYDKAAGTTLVWATNDLHQASRMTDRTLLLLGGKLWEDSETPKFFANPRTVEAEAFISGREPEVES